MAELVEIHMESMIEEVAEMRRLKIFTEQETRIILKRRRDFEYKTNGITKSLQDFKDYIQYEKILLKDIKIRRNKFRVMERKNAIEYKILKRIKYLYYVALQRFSNDYQLSMQYFKFCKESIYTEAASHVIQNMIKLFSDKEDVWKEAVDWYLKKDINQALSVVHRGLDIHKKSKILCAKAIDLELMNVKSGKESQELCSKRIERIVTSTMNNLADCKFFLEILQNLTNYSFTVDVQKLIVKSLLEKHKDEELVWQRMAEREFKGYHLVKHDETTPEYRLKKCIETYEKGLTEICIANKATLWRLYLDFLIDCLYGPDQTNNLGKDTVISALKRSSECTFLSDRYFVIWAQLLDDETKIMEVIEKGLKLTPDSVELWKLRLKYAILKDDVSQINEIVKRGTAALKNKSLPMWTICIRYHTLNSCDETIENIYEQVVSKPKEVSDFFKPDYIEWLALSKGIQFARKKYDELSKVPPFCKELHVVMARIESLDIEPNIDEWEKVLKLATQQFSDDIEFWKMLMELYLKKHKEFEQTRRDFGLSSKLLELYSSAEQAMKHNELLLANWKKEFHELQNDIDRC